jgi:hypothetical protein
MNMMLTTLWGDVLTVKWHDREKAMHEHREGQKNEPG